MNHRYGARSIFHDEMLHSFFGAVSSDLNPRLNLQSCLGVLWKAIGRCYCVTSSSRDMRVVLFFALEMSHSAESGLGKKKEEAPFLAGRKAVDDNP